MADHPRRRGLILRRHAPLVAVAAMLAHPLDAFGQEAGARALRGSLQCTDFNQTQIDYTLAVDDLGGQSIRIQGRSNGTRTQPFDLTVRADQPLAAHRITIAGGNTSNPYDGYVGLELSADGRQILLRHVGGATRCSGSVLVVSGPPLGAAAVAIAAPPTAPPAAAPTPLPVAPAPPPRPQAAARQPEMPAPKPPSPAADETAVDLAFWDSIKASANPADYRAYLEAFPKGRFVALARLRARPAPPAQTVAAPAKPEVAPAAPSKAGAPVDELALEYGRYHALVIGNNAYRDMPRLETAINDAREVAAILGAQYDHQVTLLENATRADVLRALAAYRNSLTPGDNLVIYYAGHGYVDKGVELGYWLPVDAEKDNPANWIANTDLTAAIRALRARHVIVVSDSCYSGTLLRSGNIASAPPVGERLEWLKRMLAKPARTVLSSGGVEPVVDGGGGGHSVFAKAFLDALRENDTVLDGQTLFNRIKRPVTLNSPQTPEYSDIRQAGHDGGDFLFVRRR